MDVHVRDLRYFLAVADELHFTRAAARLFVSQPTLSKQIRALELHLRSPVFDRARGAVSLTAAGRALLPHARAVVAAWDEAQQAVAEAVATESAVVTVGFSTSIGRGLMSAVSDSFAALQPGWRVSLRQISWADPTVGLADGSVDAALVWLPLPADGRFASRVLTTERRQVALPLGHRLAGREEIPFAELLDEPFLALPGSAGAARSFWLAEDAREGRPARIAGTVTTAEETFEAIAGGVGVVLLSAGNAAIYRRPDVVTRPVTGLSPSELAVAWRLGDHRPVMRSFVLACVEAADGGRPGPS